MRNRWDDDDDREESWNNQALEDLLRDKPPSETRNEEGPRNRPYDGPASHEREPDGVRTIGGSPHDPPPWPRHDPGPGPGPRPGDPGWPGGPVGPPLPPPLLDDPAPRSGSNTNTTAAWTPPTAQVFQGFTPRHAMEGFDFNREQNTGKSAKDAFAYLANQAPPPPLNDKAALGAWFTQYIQPGMNALGHTVTEVNGDTFKFKNWQGEFTVDYGRGAGAPGGALAWQVQDDAQLAPNATYTPQPTGGGVTTQTTTPPAGPRLVDPLAPITDTPNIEELMAEIDALVNGRPLPSDARALAALLRGEP